MRLILKFYTKDYELNFLYSEKTISHCEVSSKIFGKRSDHFV